MHNDFPYGYTPNEQAATQNVVIYARTNNLGKEAAPKRAAIYARVAAQDQAGQTSDALELQVNGCRGYCQECGYTVEHVYQEAFSGAKLDRPMLNKLRQAAHEKQFDVVVIWEFNR